MDLVACLSNTTHADATLRTEAESMLQRYELNPNYPYELVHILVNAALPLSVRQSAGVALKSFATKHKLEHIQSIEQELMACVTRENERRMRQMLATCIVSVVQDEEMTLWMMTWLDGMRHGNSHVVEEYMAQGNMTDDVFIQVGDKMAAALLQVMRMEQGDVQVKKRAMGLFGSMVEMAHNVQEQYPQQVHSWIMTYVEEWMQRFESGWSQPETRQEMVKVMSVLVQFFGKAVEVYVEGWVVAVMESMVNGWQGYYQACVVDTEGDEEAATAVYAACEFLGHAIQKKRVRSMLMEKEHVLRDAVQAFILYMHMTEEQVGMWMHDANVFIQEDDEDGYSFSVRVAAGDVLQQWIELMASHGMIIRVLEQVTAKMMQEAQARSSLDSHWYILLDVTKDNTLRWKTQEACLLAMGHAREEIAGVAGSGQTSEFDVGGLFQNVVVSCLQARGYPFLQGRALYFASTFADVLPAEVAAEYVKSATEALQEGMPIPVRVSALRTITNFCKYLKAEVMVSQYEALLREMMGLAGISAEDVFVLVCDAMIALAHVPGAEMPESIRSALAVTLVKMWERSIDDAIVLEAVASLVGAMAGHAELWNDIATASVPVMVNALTVSVSAEDVHGGAAAFQFLESLTKKYPGHEIPCEFVYALMGPTFALLQREDSAELLQNGQLFIKGLVLKGMPHICSWQNASGASGLDCLIGFIAKMLSPAESESASLFIGDVIVILILKAGNQLIPVLPQLMNACIQRLATSKTTTVIQSIVVVFALLLREQPTATVDLLATINVDGKSGLSILLEAWLENHGFFQGYYQLKLCIVGLKAMFDMMDERIASIQVRGDLIPGVASKKIITRSSARLNPEQYTIISAQLKIAKLLLAELHNDLDAEYGKTAIGEEAALDGDDTDEEWENLDEDNPFAPAEDYAYLSEFAECDDGPELDDDDSAFRADPLYTQNVQTMLVDAFKAYRADARIAPLFAQLNPKDQAMIARL